MRFDTADQRFVAAAREWLAGLDDQTLRDESAVFALSPGYYPTTLHRLWRAELEWRALIALPAEHSSRGPAPALPVSHPHDSDWRFTDDTARLLLREASADVPAGAVVLHIGTPTTFMLAVKRDDGRQHVLIERNPATADVAAGLVTEPHRVLCCDVADATVDELTGAVILDPPWYPTDTLAFLSCATQASRVGALMWLCQPSTATRPGVDAERQSLIEALPSLGLALDHVSPQAVRYEMPHFEAMSLRAAGTAAHAPQNWRVGDLVVLVKQDAVRAAPKDHYETEAWSEVRFGPVRVKLRRSSQEDLEPLVPGNVLDTVSRRDPVRAGIGFWTSGNRVFGLSDPERTSLLIEQCHCDLAAARFSLGRTLAHAQTLGMSRSTAAALFDVLLIELQEHTASREAA